MGSVSREWCLHFIWIVPSDQEIKTREHGSDQLVHLVGKGLCYCQVPESRKKNYRMFELEQILETM